MSEKLHSKLHLSTLPTPLEALSNLSRQIGADLFIKRDDLTTAAGGGNKVRKLEFLLAEALVRKAKSVVTIGAVQSNHCRQTALLAAKLGLEAHLVLVGEEPLKRQGNLFLDTLAGAKLHFGAHSLEEGESLRSELFEHLTAEGKAPYSIPYGGSNGLGLQGYIAAWQEMQEQAKAMRESFDVIVLSSSSGGTQAGLLLGQKIFGGEEQIIGISAGPSTPHLSSDIRNLLIQGADQLLVPTPDAPPRVEDGYVGPGYALLDERTARAIRLLARSEGLLLDPVYTGKAFAGLLDLVERGEIGGRVLFWHTGGVPALYSYIDQFEARES